jgi:hypothetical protein
MRSAPLTRWTLLFAPLSFPPPLDKMVDDEATNKQDNEGTYAKYLVPHVVISFVKLVLLRFLCFYYVIISHCERRRSYVCVFVSLGARALPQRGKYLSKQAGSLNLVLVANSKIERGLCLEKFRITLSFTIRHQYQFGGGPESYIEGRRNLKVTSGCYSVATVAVTEQKHNLLKSR